MLEELRAEDAVARKGYELRTEAGFSQRKLAQLVGTTASAAWKMRTTRGILFPCSTESLLPSAKGCKSRLSQLSESKPRSGEPPSSTTSPFVARKRLRFGAGRSDGLGDIGVDLQE